MSINQYSLDIPETTLWWTQQQQQQQKQQHQQPIRMEPIPNPSISGPPIHPSWPPHHQHQHHYQHQHQPTWLKSHTPLDPPLHYSTPSPSFNLNNQNEDEEDDDDDNDNNDDENDNSDQATTTTTTTSQKGAEDEKEHMFEKPLTPSDVGKLNRLVIPKQHAEKYFPLGASGGGGDSGECKGLLLSFEDESGKCWRFRYSYWNSSQSYVLTKGWSRYVKDKRLDAGDVVLFERHRQDAQRLFISWRRRRPTCGSEPVAHVSRAGHGKSSGDGNRNSKNEVSGGGGVGVRWTRGFYPAHPYPAHQPLPYQHDCLHAGRASQVQNQRTRPVGNSSSSSSSSSSRVLRLFGVNMECQPENDSGPSTPQCSYNMPSTQGTDTHHFYHHHQASPYSSNPHPHLVRQQPYYY